MNIQRETTEMAIVTSEQIQKRVEQILVVWRPKERMVYEVSMYIAEEIRDHLPPYIANPDARPYEIQSMGNPDRLVYDKVVSIFRRKLDDIRDEQQETEKRLAQTRYQHRNKEDQP